MLDLKKHQRRFYSEAFDGALEKLGELILEFEKDGGLVLAMVKKAGCLKGTINVLRRKYQQQFLGCLELHLIFQG
jgi:hypothetical protein